MFASLREAARRSGIPEETLRRRILTGELDARPVDDDRQYLVRLEDVGVAVPAPTATRPASSTPFFYLKIAFAAFLLAMTVAIVSAAAGSRYGTYSLCTNCAAVRHDRCLRTTVQTDRLTEVIREADPGPCRHRWVSLFPASGRSLRLLAQDMEGLGVVEAARKVDPKGAAELVRWCLGRDWGVSGFAEKASFATREEFRAWFDALRARVR